jgi:2-polyprenyl-6-methoxyphenol hydroxylase-like FAD-dependent oxidoreductase
MQQTGEYDVPVLVVGAGPAGLAAAITLAREGIDVLVIERRRVASDHPRSTVISTRSMEVLRGWGLDGQVLAGGVDVEWRLWMCETLALASAGSPLPVGYPSREQAALVSPSAPACVPQDRLEPVLLDHLRSLPAARVLLGAELVTVEGTTAGVHAHVRTADGEQQVIRSRYLVAADGASSLLRRGLGIPMNGPDRQLEGVTALFRAPLWDVLGGHRYGIYYVTTPVAEGVFLPAGPGDRWQYGGRLANGGTHSSYTGEQFTELIRLGAGVPELDVCIERISSWGSAAQVADRFRSGGVFLAGDAAHRVTPRGGTGMNIAFQDGYDIGWKLAWVLGDWASPRLLDSYETERRPVAELNVARSADPNGSLRDVEQELFADLGGRIKHLWVTTATGRVSTLDLLGPGLTLFIGPTHGGWRRAVQSVPQRVPIAVQVLDAVTARAMGFQDGGALLVRPDGVPAGLLPPTVDGASALCASVGAVTGVTGRAVRTPRTRAGAGCGATTGWRGVPARSPRR